VSTPPDPTAAVYAPASAAEAADLLLALWAAGRRTRVVYTAAPPPPLPDVAVVSLYRLDQIEQVDRENGVVAAAAAAPVAALRAAAAASNLWCPALRWLPGDLPIGRALASGLGRRSRRYGTIGDYLLGARFLAPSVGIVRHGGPVIKDATGYHLSAALVGSEDRLGVFLDALLRLVPRPAGRAVETLGPQPLPAAASLARALAHPALGAAAVEIAADPERDAAVVRVELEDAARPALEERRARLVERAGGLGVSVSPADPIPTEPPASAAVVRAGVDPADLPAVLVRLADLARRRDVPGLILAEATGGGIEVWTDPAAADAARELLFLAGVPRPAPGVERLAALTRRAFDPGGLLAFAPPDTTAPRAG